MSNQMLTREKLAQILNSFKGKIEPEQEVDFTEYDCRKPHYFQSEHQEGLVEFSTLLAKNISNDFSQMCYCQMKSEIKKMDEHYGTILIDEILDGDKECYLQIMDEQEQVIGLLCIPNNTAMAWVAHLLQDSEIAPNDKVGLSSLEETFLMDIGKTIIGALSTSLVLREAKAVKVDDKLVRDKLTLEIDPLSEMYEIAFSITNPENVISDASIYICCSHLKSIADKIVAESKQVDQQKISDARIRNLNKIFLPVSAELGNISLSMSELMSLTPGDVVTMDKYIDEQVVVKVRNKPTFFGWPVQSEGKYSLLIDEAKEI